MDLLSNPFHLLSVDITSDQRTIMERARERSLTGDSQAVGEARASLTNPRNRLTAETAWLLDVPPPEVKPLLVGLPKLPPGFSFTYWSPLDSANLLATAIYRSAEAQEPQSLASRIVELGQAEDSIDTEAVLDSINLRRVTSGFPEVTNSSFVADELVGRRRWFVAVLRSALDALPSRHLVDTLAQAVATATLNGRKHAPILIDDLVETYQLEAQEFFRLERENISTMITRVRAAATKPDDVLNQEIGFLELVVRNWDSVAQPVQLSTMGRGLSHAPSNEVADQVGLLVKDLVFQYSRLPQAMRVNDFLGEVFAEVPRIAEQVREMKPELLRMRALG